MVSTLPGVLVLRSPLRLVGLWLFHSANSLSCSKTATRMSFTTSPVGLPMNSTYASSSSFVALSRFVFRALVGLLGAAFVMNAIASSLQVPKQCRGILMSPLHCPIKELLGLRQACSLISGHGKDQHFGHKLSQKITQATD